MIESGRKIERNNRKCELCTLNDLEDEYHFVIICPFFTQIRNHYIEKYYVNLPNVFKFKKLIDSTNKQEDQDGPKSITWVIVN